MRVAVYTCVTDGYDHICSPAILTPGVDYICFNDGSIDVPKPWQDVKIDRTYLGKDANRYLKILPHLNNILQVYDLTIYIDGSVKIVGDLTPLIQQIIDAEGQTCIYEHPHQNCIYKEAYMCAVTGKDWFWRIERQIKYYRNSGYPSGAGLFECGVILRRHSEKNVQALMNAWWGAYQSGIKRDQISLPYLSWRLGTPIHNLGRSDFRFDKKYFSLKLFHHRPLTTKISNRIRGYINQKFYIIFSRRQ